MMIYALIRCEQPTHLSVSLLPLPFLVKSSINRFGDWSSFCWDNFVLGRSILSLDVSDN